MEEEEGATTVYVGPCEGRCQDGFQKRQVRLTSSNQLLVFLPSIYIKPLRDTESATLLRAKLVCSLADPLLGTRGKHLGNCGSLICISKHTPRLTLPATSFFAYWFGVNNSKHAMANSFAAIPPFMKTTLHHTFSHQILLFNPVA